MNTEKIWHGDPRPEDLVWMNKDTLAESLEMRVTEVGPDYLKGTMPVDGRTKQPFGLLHGGASVALAETLGSIASYLVVNPENFIGVGIEINANHVKAATGGIVTGICRPVHIKGRNHIWDIRIYNDKGELLCISRFTCAIVSKAKMQEKIKK